MKKRAGDSAIRHIPSGPAGRLWPSTPWDILRRWNDLSGLERQDALDRMIRLYYMPVYRFFQRVLGIHGDDLKTVTQDFFTRLIEKDFLKNLRHEGNFRGFMKLACRRHYINWIEKNRPRAVSLDASDGMARDVPIPEDRLGDMVDEELRRWYVEEARERVRKDLLAQGKEIYVRVFDARIGDGSGGTPTNYETIAKTVGRGVYDVRNYLTKARTLFRETLLALAAERSEDPKRELEDLGLLKYAL